MHRASQLTFSRDHINLIYCNIYPTKGTPFPSQERNAIDTVMQFAIEKLGFNVSDIILYGWSIGGYTSSWAAMMYPDVKAIVLDATFDDVLPLALAQMPKVIAPIVCVGIKEYANLNVGEQIIQYNGPIVLVRRTQDEIMCLRPGDLSTNRANVLLQNILEYRYPFIFENAQIGVLKNYLALKSANLQEKALDEIQRLDVSEYLDFDENSRDFPSQFGKKLSETEKNKFALYLMKKYLIDFKSTHCTLLPAGMFTVR